MPARPDPIRWYPAPRPGGPPRKMAVLTEPDEVAWSGIARGLAGPLERRLRSGVLANRTRRSGTALRPLGPALRAARDGSLRLRRRRPVVVATDVFAFYPSVRPTVVHRALRWAGPWAARRAAGLLERWGSEGYAGLPIGPPASAVVANAVLASADEALGDLPLLRWVDDYLIAVRSEREAALALERLDEGLERLGLVRSERKTRLLARGDAWLGGGAGPSDVRVARA